MTEQASTPESAGALEPEPIPMAEAASHPGTAQARPDANDGLDAGDASLLSLIDRLSALLDRTELSELEVQVGSTGLVLRKPSAIAPMVAAGAAVPAAGAAPGDGGAATAGGAGPAAATGPAARPAVMAPLSGIWYGAPAPGSAPYVSLGGEVAVGQVIGLIEAMKLFNEIKSDKAGRVVKINAEDGKLVRAKQPLIEVDPL
jgi:acetyl-CoA carboxylase biotin carboxyl carrier protein